MSRELDKCSMERDRFKVLVEQFKSKKPVLHCQDISNNIYKFTPTNTVSGGDMLTKTRDHNNMLKIEVESLRSRLEEATADIVALRKQLQKRNSLGEGLCESRKLSNSMAYSSQDYEQLVQELEKIQKKYQQIQLDYRATLDEKEEIVSDRDYYKDKVQRLNQQVSFILLNRVKPQQVDQEADPPKPIIDIDTLVTENKYLHERITQLQVEKEILKRTLTKYKTLLDNRSKKEPLSYKKGFIDVMTQKQVREFLDTNTKGLKRNSAAELRSVCLGLFEALNDKSIALQHQRKTNQILANRLTELEKTLESWCNGQKCIPIFPSQMLLEEFLPDNGSVKSDDLKDNDIKRSNSKEKLKSRYDESDEELNKDNSDGDDSSGDPKVNYDEDSCYGNMTKIVLPVELEELVKEALAELKPVD